VKLCKDCKFIDWPDDGVERRTYAALCTHPSSHYQPPRNPVTGEGMTTRFLSCEHVRSGLDKDYCGPEGRYWEAF
jgi:hypothetical protein